MEISKHPIINIKKSGIDKYIETVTFLMELSIVFIPLHYFSLMPDSVPIHFNAAGEADSYGSKYVIWLLPVISILLHFLFKWIIKRPHLYNYSVKITEENASRQYRLAIRLLRIIDLLIALLFLYITYTICTLALDQKASSSISYVFAFIGLMFASILFYLYHSKKINYDQ